MIASKVFQLFAVLPSIVDARVLPEKSTVLVAVVRAEAMTSAVVEVSFTTTLAVEPSAVIVIVFASVKASATNEMAIVAVPSTPIVAVPETAPPVISADSTPVSA